MLPTGRRSTRRASKAGAEGDVENVEPWLVCLGIDLILLTWLVAEHLRNARRP